MQEITSIAIPSGAVFIFCITQFLYTRTELSKRVTKNDFDSKMKKFDKEFRKADFCDERSGNIENQLTEIKTDVKGLYKMKDDILSAINRISK